MSEEKEVKKEMELGVQPLDQIMTDLKLSNHDLVAASTEQLSHKVVQKGRKGRRLTLNAQHKILNAIVKLRPEAKLTLKKMFSYTEEKLKT